METFFITTIFVIIIILILGPMFIEATRNRENETYLYQQDVEESELLVKAKESLERCEKFRRLSEDRETQKVIDEITKDLELKGTVETNVWRKERAKSIGDYFANKGFNCSYKYVSHAETGNPRYSLKISPVGGPANREIVEYVSDYSWTG